MSQLTIYLTKETQLLVERAARASGVSKSRWVAEVIQKYVADEWPRSCLDLAGRFADFPLREDAPGESADVPRIGY